MKQNAKHITKEEAEQLCRLYMDCQLSVLEETELEYVLMQSELDSPLLRETRALMGISRSVNLLAKKKRLFMTWGWRAAACVAILIGCAALLRNHITTETDAIANKEGVELSVNTTKVIAKSEATKKEPQESKEETEKRVEIEATQADIIHETWQEEDGNDAPKNIRHDNSPERAAHHCRNDHPGDGAIHAHCPGACRIYHQW